MGPPRPRHDSVVVAKLERYELIGPLNPAHFFPTLDAAIDTFCQETGAKWTAPKQAGAEAR